MTQVFPEPTPNPEAIKFTLDRPATEGRGQTFRAGSSPEDSPLGAEVFALGGVTNVFLTADFVSVTKESDASWDDLVPKVIDVIIAHFDG